MPKDENSYTFVIHTRPKLLLASEVQSHTERFSAAFVVIKGDIAWSGSVEEAGEQHQQLRRMLRRTAEGKNRARRQRPQTAK